jgi:hypothetical protein
MARASMPTVAACRASRRALAASVRAGDWAKAVTPHKPHRRARQAAAFWRARIEIETTMGI